MSSSAYWLIPIALGLFLLCWLLKGEAKDAFVLSTFSRPRLSRYLPYLYKRASRLLIEKPEAYIERHPVKVVRGLQTIASDMNSQFRDKAMLAIVDNIDTVAALDEGEAAKALLTVINKSDSSSLTHNRALIMRPGIIDNLAMSDPVQAVLLAQKGIVAGEAGEELYNQSCALALKHLDSAFAIEPLIAAHAACNIAAKTQAETRESAIWLLLSHINIITRADFESGHAASEQAVLLGALDTPLHKAALNMWEWHIQQILHDAPLEVISKMFYGFRISTAPGPNKWTLYEHGFDFLLKNPAIIKEWPEDVIKVSLSIGLRAHLPIGVQKKTVQVWTAALKELCARDLGLALRAANEAMTYTAPGSPFERQAQAAYWHLKRIDDQAASDAVPVFS
jgi:hypothetical protein